jgi:hypothetical protein
MWDVRSKTNSPSLARKFPTSFHLLFLALLFCYPCGAVVDQQRAVPFPQNAASLMLAART